MFKKRNRNNSESSIESPQNTMESRHDDYHSGYRGSKKVYVSNINFEATVQDVIDEFSSAGEVSFVQMLKDDNKRFKGCAVVTFKDSEMANKAVETLNRRDFHGRKLVVREEDTNRDRSMERKKPRMDNNSIKPTQLMPPALSSIDQNSYGLSATFLSSLGIDLPLVTTLFVANLDYDVTEKMLKEIFVLAGNVISCEIFKSKDGSSRGFGIVDFEHPVEAVQAISMLHNQNYRDRVLAVRMDRSEKRRDTKVRLPDGLKSVGMGLGMDGIPLKDMKTLPDLRQTLPNISPVDPMTPSLMSSQLNSLGGSLMEPFGRRLGLNQGPRGLDPPSSFPAAGSLGSIMRITNLPMDYTSEDLRKLIWNCGDVVIAEMRSKGAGIVKLRTEREAQRAVQMLDRQPMEGRLLNAVLL